MIDRKICFICSAGGHLEQLRQLKGVREEFNSFFVVPDVASTEKMIDRTYKIPVLNHGRSYGLTLLRLAFREFAILIKERPTHIISTGAAPAIPMMLLGRLLGSKTIYIESFARRNELNRTGKFLYKKVDLFIVQWPELKERYPDSAYWGWIY